jgi:pyruvate/2-oxoglutarate dehydrogenase complex dihydrolipoamide acyltransferase (E2) component
MNIRVEIAMSEPLVSLFIRLADKLGVDLSNIDINPTHETVTLEDVTPPAPAPTPKKTNGNARKAKAKEPEPEPEEEEEPPVEPTISVKDARAEIGKLISNLWSDAPTSRPEIKKVLADYKVANARDLSDDQTLPAHAAIVALKAKHLA